MLRTVGASKVSFAGPAVGKSVRTRKLSTPKGVFNGVDTFSVLNCEGKQVVSDTEQSLVRTKMALEKSPFTPNAE